jgi:hypothetical protein
MAMPRTWLPRAEEILDVLRRMKSKQLDRAAIEELFLLQRRAANELMTQAGAPKAKRGEAVLINRTSLLTWTERIFKDESWQLQRQAETSDELSRSIAEVRELRAAMAKEGKQPVSFPLDEKYLRATCSSLSPAITIGPGRITVEIPNGDSDEMVVSTCQLLYELAMALNNDPDGFRNRIVERPGAHDLESIQEILASLQKA